MSFQRSLRDRFWASTSWPWWKQLVVASAVILAVGAFLSVVLPRDSGSAPLTDSPLGTVWPSSSVTAEAEPTTPQPTVSVTATVAESVPTTTPDNEAISILAMVPVEREHRGGYNRDLFAVWTDLDGNGCDTREDVLAAEEIRTELAELVGCELPTGSWYSAYDGATTASPSTFDIDHLVPLNEAWDSGAWAWSPERRIAFANDLTDPRTLVAVSAESNRSKGDKDPSNWLPAPGSVCQYISDWVAIKARWSLSMDESESGRIRNLLRRDCQGTIVAPWPAPVG